ncbi:HRDC domain-containing protein [Singulisphaera sp. Ch08]|uniref:HRDC domain-containing protein n=1 Tax=Singulisphaera sp. Ch08 TaxID=3120278 RepID=A0AAU7CGF1_9BACT
MPDATEEPLIATPSALGELVDHLRASGRFAFDTEFVSEETFEPVLCLIQVATRERLAVIDPLAIDDLSPFWNLVIDPTIEVVMHAASEDLRICRFKTGTVPRRVFDVQIAAGLVGFGYPLSLVNLIGQALRITVSGGETRTDWRRRPLTAAQLRYALDDVRYLLDLADLLGSQLKELGRVDWAEGEFAHFVSSIQNRVEEERWRRLPGLHQLNRRSLEAARRLAEWRFAEARRSNRPIRQLLRDDLLVAIAKRQPSSRRDLEALRDFNRPHLLSRAADLLAVIASAQLVPPEELPEPPDRHDDGPGLTMVVNLLAAALAQCCAQSKVAAGLVGTSNDLKDLIRWHSQNCPDSFRPELAEGWRAEVCGKPLLDVLSGRCALRVADPRADVPVVLEPLADRRPK